MPQLDILILQSTGLENSLAFWIIYFIVSEIYLVKFNYMFNLRKFLKNYFLFFDILVLNNLYFFNFLNFKTYINKLYLTNIVNLQLYVFNIWNLIYFINNYLVFINK